MARILLSIWLYGSSCYIAGDQGAGAPSLQRQTETIGAVQTGEENTPGRL